MSRNDLIRRLADALEKYLPLIEGRAQVPHGLSSRDARAAIDEARAVLRRPEHVIEDTDENRRIAERAVRGIAEPTPEPLEAQIDRLARFIMEDFPGEPSRSEGAVDCAIRLLKEKEAR